MEKEEAMKYIHQYVSDLQNIFYNDNKNIFTLEKRFEIQRISKNFNFDSHFNDIQQMITFRYNNSYYGKKYTDIKNTTYTFIDTVKIGEISNLIIKIDDEFQYGFELFKMKIKKSYYKTISNLIVDY